MIILSGTFDGKQVILDKVPTDIPANTPVRILVNPAIEPTGLDAIIGMARETNLPPDFAAQHHHYIDGLPKR